jgi:2-polyprenyl-3-methyl-5-hydroxy-6-metoxy-1,4-benzoquinol methylase
MTHRPCDTCHALRFQVIYAAHPVLDGPLVRCTGCGLVQVNPPAGRYHIPDGTDPASRAEAYARQASKVRDELRYDPALEAAEGRVRERFWRDRLVRIERRMAPGRLLDVGSDGQFLGLARDRGWSVSGVQPHEETCASARRTFGVDIVPATLEEAGFPDSIFDVVTLFHVIEHVPSPAALCRQVFRVLRPCGLIVVETPNIDSLWFRLLGTRWRQFIPDHYWFFSPASLAGLLDRAGFALAGVERVGKAASLRLLLNRVERIARRPLPRATRVLQLLGLDGRVLWINPGDIILAFARRGLAAHSIPDPREAFASGAGSRARSSFTTSGSAAAMSFCSRGSFCRS